MTSTSDDDLGRFQAKFRLRRLMTIVASGLLIAIFVAVKSKVISIEWLAVALIGMAGVAGVAWRCPRCGGRFGIAVAIDTCPHCYLSLGRRPPA
jgi:hypothetical protein